MLELDCTIAKIKDVVLYITSPYRLNSASKILLNIMNSKNKIKVTLDSYFGLECLLRIHHALGVNTFMVEVALVLWLQFQDSSLLHAFFTNLKVELPNELINQLNDSVEKNALLGDKLPLRKLLLRDKLCWG